MRQTNSQGLQKSSGEKGQHGYSKWEHAPTLAWTGFYCFLVALRQRRFSFLTLRFTLSDYFLQVTKKRMLQIQGNDKSDWSGYTPSLGQLSTDFRELLQRYTLNICCLNSGWGSFSKSKPQSSLDIMQAWFPVEKLICGPGSCVLPRTSWFFEPGLSYIYHCYVDWFPIRNNFWKGTRFFLGSLITYHILLLYFSKLASQTEIVPTMPITSRQYLLTVTKKHTLFTYSALLTRGSQERKRALAIKKTLAYN